MITFGSFEQNCQAQPQPQLQPSWAEIALFSQLWGTTHPPDPPPTHPTPGIVVLKLHPTETNKTCSFEHCFFIICSQFVMTCSQLPPSPTRNWSNLFDLTTTSQPLLNYITSTSQLLHNYFTTTTQILHNYFTITS